MKLEYKIRAPQFSMKTNLAFLVLLYIMIETMEVPYIRRYIWFSGTALFYLIAATIALIIYAGRGINKYKEIFLFILFLVILSVSTVFNGGNLIYLIRTLAPLIVVASMFLYCREEQERRDVINVLVLFYVILMVIDVTTILLYPNGLYSDGLYSTYWFLGYKTQRMVYIFPLLIFWEYKQQFRKKKQLKSFIILVAIVLFVLQKTDNMSAILGVAFFVFMKFIILLVGNQSRITRSIIYILTDFRLFLIIYVALFVIFIVYQNMTLISNFLVNILERSVTISGRTRIWTSCLRYIEAKPLFGYGILTSDEYIVMTGMRAGTNAHNIVLTYLLSGGIIGTIIFFLINYSISKRLDKTPFELILIVGIYSILIVGISSSILALSPAFWGFYFLLLSERQNK